MGPGLTSLNPKEFISRKNYKNPTIIKGRHLPNKKAKKYCDSKNQYLVILPAKQKGRCFHRKILWFLFVVQRDTRFHVKIGADPFYHFMYFVLWFCNNYFLELMRFGIRTQFCITFQDFTNLMDPLTNKKHRKEKY